MVKVSVVIPVYNVEDFLNECLDSIVNQTLEDIEIICINDGSTDNSLNILNEYAQKDDRFTILSQENGGHAVATNNGMKLAKGEYLYLMDSDDILSLNALEDTYKVAKEKDVDFVIFQSTNYYMDTNEYIKKENYSMNRLADFVGDKVFNWKDIKDYIFTITVTPWSKLYNREFVEKSGAKFPEGLIFDDNVFFWEVLFSAKRITFHRDYLFTRRWYSSSSTKAGDKRFIDSLTIYNMVWDVFKKYGTFDEFKVYLYNTKVKVAHIRFSKIKEEFKELYFEEMKQNFSNLRNDSIFEDFYINLIDRHRNIFDFVMNSENHMEYSLKLENYDLIKKNKKLNKNNKELTKKLKKQKKINNELLNSNSWKLTKPFRSITNRFR